ncbi:hypothetical protein KR018_005149 [Drosophila ironensis]|nr:hypothetical protein KR018_005149 [Drosophila ironensis]
MDDQGQAHLSHAHQEHVVQQQHHFQEASSSGASGADRWDFVGALGKVARMFFSARKGNPG